MLHPSPAGGSGELFPSPAKGHHDNPGLTDEQGEETQALLNTALSGYYPRGDVNTLLSTRATTQQLADAIATREPIFAELPQSRVTQLVSDLAARATTQQLADAIATRQPIVVDDSLQIRHVRFLQDSLDGKQALLGDVEGTSVSLRYGTKLRKVYGHSGITVTHSLDLGDLDSPTNFQIQVSGAELQSSIATLSSTVADVSDSLTIVEQALDTLSQAAPSTSSLLPNTGPATTDATHRGPK